MDSNKKLNWRTDELPTIFDECLDCIRKVELNRPKEKAVSGECIILASSTLAPNEKLRCGEYYINEPYYNRCNSFVLGDAIDVSTGFPTWQDCALNTTCAGNCVRNYVNLDRSNGNCHRRTKESRLCIDYGTIHAFGEQGCLSRNDGDPIVLQYNRWMETKCKVANPKNNSPTPPPELFPYTAVIASVVATTIFLVCVVIGMVCYVQRRKKRNMARRDFQLSGTNANSYGFPPDRRPGGLNLVPMFNVEQCSDEIQTMVKQRLVSITDVEIMEEIGRGQFGVIRRAKCYTDPEHTQSKAAAVKIIRNQKVELYEEEVKSFLREAYIMSQFDHANVLNLLGIIWELGEAPVVICPYMGKGSLLDLVRKSELKFSDVDLLNFVGQIGAGLAYLESMKFVHRDIALRNCLVSDLYVVKISDFGLTRDIYDSRIYECADVTEKRLPWKWLAPECIKVGSFTHKSDVWSFGITIWELYTSGSSPYPAIGNLSVLQDCLEAGYRLSKPDKLSQPLYDTMRLMWDREPKNRPTFLELVTTIKLIAAHQGPHDEYSYTMEPKLSSVSSSVSDYIRPMRQVSGESKLYADSPVQTGAEPEIY